MRIRTVFEIQESSEELRALLTQESDAACAPGRRGENAGWRRATSFLCAGIAYFLWMAAFFLSSDLTLPVVRGLFWLMAPVATAKGIGLARTEQHTHRTVTYKKLKAMC